MNDGIATPDILQEAQSRVANRQSLESIVARLRQVEPALLQAIEREAKRTKSLESANDTIPPPAIASAGVLRCGVMVAEALHRGHTKLWNDWMAERTSA